jgi:hypothetical protein
MLPRRTARAMELAGLEPATSWVRSAPALIGVRVYGLIR